VSIIYIIEGKDKNVFIFRSKFRLVKAFYLFGHRMEDLKRKLRSSDGFIREPKSEKEFPEESTTNRVDESPDYSIFKNINF
jgi:hypothetical protein